MKGELIGYVVQVALSPGYSWGELFVAARNDEECAELIWSYFKDMQGKRSIYLEVHKVWKSNQPAVLGVEPYDF